MTGILKTRPSEEMESPRQRENAMLTMEAKTGVCSSGGNGGKNWQLQAKECQRLPATTRS